MRPSLEGKAKGPRSGETTNDATTSPRHLRTSAPPSIPRRTTNNPLDRTPLRLPHNSIRLRAPSHTSSPFVDRDLRHVDDDGIVAERESTEKIMPTQAAGSDVLRPSNLPSSVSKRVGSSLTRKRVLRPLLHVEYDSRRARRISPRPHDRSRALWLGHAECERVIGRAPLRTGDLQLPAALLRVRLRMSTARETLRPTT
jgi:hypothetical protein